MGNRLQPNKLVTISDLPTAQPAPIRVRLTGRVVGVDGLKSKITIQDDGIGLVIDLTSAVGSEDGYLPRLKDLVMVTGWLIVANGGVDAPRLGVSGPEPTVWQDRIVEAVLVKPCEELDQHSWRESVALLSSR